MSRLSWNPNVETCSDAPNSGTRVRVSCEGGSVVAVIPTESWQETAAHAALLWSRSSSGEVFGEIITDMIVGLASEIATANNEEFPRNSVAEESMALTIAHMTLALLSCREEVGAMAMRLIKHGDASIDVKIESSTVRVAFKDRAFEHVTSYELDGFAHPLQ